MAEVSKFDDFDYVDDLMMNAALGYAERDWRVFPAHTSVAGRCSCGKQCTAPGKHPRIKEWQLEATTDRAKIERWWKQWPNANVAIATGAESGIFVVDLDGEAGMKAVQNWAVENDWEPDTLQTSTGRGRHLIFAHPGGRVRTRSGVFQGVDIRGDGGYVIAPPSRHHTGKLYEWVERKGEPSNAPSWLLEAAGATPNESEQVGKEQAEESQVDANEVLIPVGQRNTALTSMAGTMRAEGLEYPAIKEQLESLNQNLCEEPLDCAEVEAIARSISRYPAGDNGGGGRIRRDENPLYWFQFEPKEYLASRDVSLMNAAQRGCHMCLVAECWTDAGYLPSDPRLLYRLARADCSFEQFDAELQTVMASFQLTEDGNRYVHPKLARVWQEKYAGYQQKKAAGKASAAQRKAKASAEKEVA